MATATYTFIPNQQIFHVSLEDGIREGIVKTVNLSINGTSTVITYSIKFENEAAVKQIVGEDQLYATLGDAGVGSAGGGALEAYQALLVA
jgi:hypothetical protein